jgi:hypothetical protein
MAKKRLGASPQLKLSTKSTASLDKSVANDLDVPDRPLTIEEIQKLNDKDSKDIQWSSHNEKNEPVQDSSTEAEMNIVDEEVD